MIFDPGRTIVRPPRDGIEAEFTGLRTRTEIEQRALEIARDKGSVVWQQLQDDTSARSVAAVLTADTVIIAADETQGLVVLGQPQSPDPDPGRSNRGTSPGVTATGQAAPGQQPPLPARDAVGWTNQVRDWFQRYYLGRTHTVLTAVCLSTSAGVRQERLVSTEVTFRADGGRWLEWYLSTGEPLGKAGGYAVQGAGALFVERIEGSPSNVIGLPLWETFALLRECRLVDAATPPPRPGAGPLEESLPWDRLSPFDESCPHGA
jgi:septum formation protein